VDPAGPGAVGTLSITGGLALSPTSTFFADVAPGPTGDRLALTGAFTRSGTLEATPIGGYTPTGGDQFTPVSAGTPPTGSWTDPPGWISAVVGNAVVTTYTPAFRVLFSASAGAPLGLYSVDGDGANLFNISSTEGTSGFVNPRWSPNRTRVAYTFTPIGQPNNHLRVGAADGSAFAALVTDVSTFRPRYGLDGVRLAFECIVNGVEEVCVIPNVSGPIGTLDRIGEGTGKIVVSNAAETIDDRFVGGPGAFAWNPSVLDELAFFRDTTDATSGFAVSHLFTAKYDGSGVTLHTPNGMDAGEGPLRVVGTFDWSVTGLIAFTAYPAGQQPFNTGLYVIGADGSGLKRLASLPTVSGPVFSPDGSEVLFAYNGDGTALHRILSSATPGEEVMVTPYFNSPFTLDDAWWDWSPDGTEIVLPDPTYSQGSLVIVKIKSTTDVSSFTGDRVAIGRVAGATAVFDRQPSWRP
jgi:hypothetical protein